MPDLPEPEFEGRGTCVAQALVRERERRRRDGAPPEVLLLVERELVLLSLEWLQQELQSGHAEQAVACLQAQVEFACFAPDFPGVLMPLTCNARRVASLRYTNTFLC